jgi:hypothetical protein
VWLVPPQSLLLLSKDKGVSKERMYLSPHKWNKTEGQSGTWQRWGLRSSEKKRNPKQINCQG